jgi:hypothetical protein
MLEREEPALVRRAQRAVAAEALRGNDAMAWDEDAEAVLRAERSGRARRTGPAGKGGELSVRDDVAARNRAQRAREVASERRQLVEIELDVGEVVVGTGEEGAQARDESWHELGTVS